MLLRAESHSDWLSQGVPHDALKKREVVNVIHGKFVPGPTNLSKLEYHGDQYAIKYFLHNHSARKAMLCQLMHGSVMLHISGGRKIWELPKRIENHSFGKHIHELSISDPRVTGAFPFLI